MSHQALDVLIVEDEPQLATLHAEFIEKISTCGWWLTPPRWPKRGPKPIRISRG